jgi:hypothetical protein
MFFAKEGDLVVLTEAVTRRGAEQLVGLVARRYAGHVVDVVVLEPTGYRLDVTMARGPGPGTWNFDGDVRKLVLDRLGKNLARAAEPEPVPYAPGPSYFQLAWDLVWRS